jgi:hypothetical protein
MSIRKEDCPFLEDGDGCALENHRTMQYCTFHGSCDTLRRLESFVERVLEIDRRKREDH